MLAHTLPELESQLQTHFPERLLPLPGGPLAWRSAGADDADATIVLLHGISSGAASWLGVVRALQQRCLGLPVLRVLAWDAPGYGASRPLRPSAPTSADYGEVLTQALDHLGVRRCTLVGHSLGALMAAHWAVQHPDRVQNLVLISPAGGYGTDAQAAARVRQQRLANLQAHGIAGLAARIDQRLAAPEAPQHVRQWLRWNAARLTPGGYAQAVELLCRSDLRAVAGLLPMPRCVWVGMRDKVTDPVACAELAQDLGAKFMGFAGAAHAIPLEKPEDIALYLWYQVMDRPADMLPHALQRPAHPA